MINPKLKYPGQVIDSNPDYPYGEPQNASFPGSGNGTPLEKDWVGDWFGLCQAIAITAGITPNEIPDNANSSQLLTALQSLFAPYSVYSRKPDEPHGAFETRNGIIDVGRAAPGDATKWLRTGDSWMSNDVSVETYLRFATTFPLAFTLQQVHVWIDPPSHGTWPPANAPTVEVSKYDVVTGTRTSILSTSDSLGSQSAYESRHTISLLPSSLNQFDSYHHHCEIAVTPEYGTNAVVGTRIYGVQIVGTLDRGRGL